MSPEKETLIKQLGFPEKEAEELMSISRLKNMQAQEYFITEGQVPRKFGLLLSGLFRYLYIDQDGNEYTKGIVRGNNIFSSYNAMLHGQPSFMYIQALEDSTFLEIDYQLWLGLQEKNNFWDKFLIILLQKGYSVKEKRERELLLLDAESRYQIFLEEFPGMENRIKQHIIASYLGIKPESLSRIRKKLPS